VYGLDIGFIDHLHTPLGTTSNYSTVSNLHTLQITAAFAKLFPACFVFNSHSLATASNIGDSLASRAHVVTVRRISYNWTSVNCQLNYSAISSQPTLQNSTQLPTLNWTLSLSPTNCFTSFHFTSLNWTALSRQCGPRYIASGWTPQETLPPTVLLLLLWAVS
jgi:hypothetical protein